MYSTKGNNLQLELFEKTDMEKVVDRLDNLESSLDNLRKGLFKRHGDLAAKVLKIIQQQDELTCQLRIVKQILDEHYQDMHEFITKIA